MADIVHRLRVHIDGIAEADEAADEIERLRKALRVMCDACPEITIRDVLDAGDDAIAAFRLNPWCLNEGRASEDGIVNTHDLLEY